MRALVVGVLVVLVVLFGAVPAAGAPDPGGRRSEGHKPSGAQVADQVHRRSAPAARSSEGTRRRSVGQRVAARPAAVERPAPAGPKPAPGRSGSAPDRGPEAPTPRGRSSTSPAHQPPQVRSSTTAAPRPDVSGSERIRHAPASARPIVTGSAHPFAILFAASPAPPAPPVMPVTPVQAAAAVELEPRQWWPALPGPASHPAFPAALTAMLIGFVVLGCRGDRRDPKLAAAALDDRDDRARFG